MNLRTQIAPQVVRETGFALLTIARTVAVSRINALVHRINNLSHMHIGCSCFEFVATARAAHTLDQIVLTKFGEELLYNNLVF